MAKPNHINDQSGIALVIALVMLLALTVLGISSLVTSTLDTQMSGNERRAAEALNLADAGIERGLMDLLTDYSMDRGGDSNWGNKDFTRMSLTVVGSTVDVTLPDNSENYGDFAVAVNTQWGDPFNSATSILEGPTDHAVDPYGGPVELPAGSGNYYRVLLLRDSDEPDEIYMRSYAQHSTGAKKILQLHLKINKIDVWRNAVFAGRGSASASITGNINVAGPVHVLGTGATNQYTISGSSGVFNGYKDMGNSNYSASDLTGRILYDADGNGEYDNLLVVGHDDGGNPIYSLESEFRVKNVQVQLASGSATLGEAGGQGSLDPGIAQYAGLYWQSELDSILANKEIDTSDPDNSLNAKDINMPDGYDLGDKLQMPSFEDPYTDDEGTHWDKYQNYVENKSIQMPTTACNLIAGSDSSPTAAFIAGDANGDGACTAEDATLNGMGCIAWNPGAGTKASPATIVIEGRVQFNSGCSNDNFTIGDAGGHIAYEGKGLIYGSKTMKIQGSIVTKSGTGNFIKDNLLGILTTGSMNIAEGGSGDSNTVIMGGLFAADLISTEQPSEIIGSIVSNEFCMGGTELNTATPDPNDIKCKAAGGGNASDIYYVPKLSDEIIKLGMIRGQLIYTFKTYKWEEKW